MFPKLSWPDIWTMRLKSDGRIIDCTEDLAKDLLASEEGEVINFGPGLRLEYQGHVAIIKLVHQSRKSLTPN